MKFIWVYAFLVVILSITLLVEAEESEGSANEEATNEDNANKEANKEDSDNNKESAENNEKKTEKPADDSEREGGDTDDGTEGDNTGGSNDSSQNNEGSGDAGSGSSNSANQGGGSSGGGEGDKSKSDEEDADEGTIISNENEESHRRNRHFPKCKCLQRFRTSYLTGNVCGRAALCYWELWNYKKMKAASQGSEALRNYTNGTGKCDEYWIKKHTCLIGYPQPRLQNQACVKGLQVCEKNLSVILYNDCAPLREAYGLLKPQEVDWRIRTENLNYDMTQDKATVFRARPTREHPKWNNYYVISCPVIYHYPYFTIDILLKDLDPNIDYNETSALTGVAELIPKYAREGMNSERILNFDALSLDETYIHWCGIPRNYVCVRKELDPRRNQCKKLASLRSTCEPNAPNSTEKKSEKAAQDNHAKTKDELSTSPPTPPQEDSTEPPKKETEKPKGKKG